ncbi:MAG: beta-lactamase family protein [Gammaproteobacteria bacterium]|nr:beta-lactamase family protein [Gammaproteobacteria bacterium]
MTIMAPTKHHLVQTTMCALLMFAFVSHTSAQQIPRAKAESVGMSSERLARIEAVMRSYIDAGKTPGVITAIIRKGKLVHFKAQGEMDVDQGKEMRTDAIFRIASMTKPITSLALMMLWEEGHFQLRDPVTKFIPEFTDVKVSTTSDASGESGELIKPNRAITIRDLLTHTAGFANAYIGNTQAYRQALLPPASNNAELITQLAKIPLNYQPGEAWQYSIATDVVGRLVEIISGMSLDEFFTQRIFLPLDMPDTHFYLDAEKANRLTAQYTPGEDEKIVLQDPGSNQSRWVTGPKTLYRGAGGLASTVRDYLRFQLMMLNGGSLDGVRLLAPSTVSLMLENHTADLPLWLPGPGMGFGLGYAVVTDRGEAATPLSLGSAYWGGAYCTFSWIDPDQQIVGVLMTQVRPYAHINIRQDFQVLTYQAVIE